MMNTPVILFAHSTKTLGDFTIEADQSVLVTFTPGPHEKGRKDYFLRSDMFPGYSANFSTPYDAIKAVAQHRTGIPEWDNLKEPTSDYAGEWEREKDKRIQMRMLEAYLEQRPNTNMRTLVDYFEGRHFYYLERHAIRKLFIEMMKSGQVKKLPSMLLAPAEMSGLERIAKKLINHEENQ